VLLVLDEHASIHDVQVHPTMLNSTAFHKGTNSVCPDRCQATAKNNFAVVLIVKCVCGPTCVLESGKMKSLAESDLCTMLLDPLARCMEKHCVPTARHVKAELVAATILTRTIEGFKKNFRDKFFFFFCFVQKTRDSFVEEPCNRCTQTSPKAYRPSNLLMLPHSSYVVLAI